MSEKESENYFKKVDGKDCVNEAGVYLMACQCESHAPIAKEFRQWLFKDVLPQLRTKGLYVMKEDEKVGLLENLSEMIRRHFAE